jgi:glycosyltransferase involved in cell wall biosynthesis
MEGSIVILRAGWLPTRQANGLQTISMGHAFAKLGFETTLYYIPSPYVKNDPLRFCDLKPHIKLKPLPRAVFPIDKRFKLERLRSLPSFLHAFIWSGMVSYLTSGSKVDLFFVREPMVAWWLGRLGLPTVLEIHEMPKGWEQIFIRWASQYPSVKLVLAVTEHLRSDLRRELHVPSEKLLTLHDGVDLDTFSCSITKTEARQRLGLPLDMPLVVYTGQLSREKGVDTLVKAAPMLNGTGIVIVGGALLDKERLQRALQKQKLDENNVTLTGFKSHSEALLFQKAADIVVLPHSVRFVHSKYHTSPLKLFEYMASGVPIVASDLPSHREVIRHGENGWLVTPDNPAALAKGIHYLLENNAVAERLAKQATRDVQSYTWEQRAIEILTRLSISSHVNQSRKCVTSIS